MTTFPAAGDYYKAVQAPARAFTVPKLQAAEFVWDALGPSLARGSSAVVFQAAVEGQPQALRCYIREDASSRDRYGALDAYLAAFQIPNLLRDLFAEGSLSTAFTALFTRIWDKEGDAPAWQLANLTISAMIFILGGMFPLALVLVLVVWLPESPRFLAARQNLSPRNAALLRSLGITSAPGDAVDLARGNPIRMLFGQGYALQTVLLWIIFFCSLLNLFLFAYWMPTVLNLIGMSPAQAVFTASLRDLGAIFAVLYLGLAIDRTGPERALALHYAAGAVFIAMIALFALPYAILCVIIFLAGMTIIGSQTGVNGACGKLYPARMRTSGIGWALGIGRLGGIVAPVLGGYLLAVGLPPTQIFLVACLFALIAAAATALLVFRNTPVESA